MTVPVLIFGVSATLGAISEPEPFLSPFLLLCAGDARGAALVLARDAALAARACEAALE